MNRFRQPGPGQRFHGNMQQRFRNERPGFDNRRRFGGPPHSGGRGGFAGNTNKEVIQKMPSSLPPTDPPTKPVVDMKLQSNTPETIIPVVTQSPSAAVPKAVNVTPKKNENGDDNTTTSQSMQQSDGNNERKFSWHCRLFVGNVPADTTEKEFLSWFEPFGEVQEPFVNPRKAFGFIRLETRARADAAKKALDGKPMRGRFLRLRYAAHGAAIRVKHLHYCTSNELLGETFSMFGEVERATVCIDDKGKPSGEGIVEFVRKSSALQAVKRVAEGVLLLGSGPRPVTCELLEHKDEVDGLPEIFINKTQDYMKEREASPRFAPPNSFEFTFGQKWKELYAHYEDQKKQLDVQFEDACGKLELEETAAMMEHQTTMMRQDLLRRQEELRRMEEQQQMELQRRMEMRRQEEARRRMGMDMDRRMMFDEEGRPVGGSEMFMDEQMMSGNRGAGPMKPPPLPPALGGPMGNQQGAPNQMRRGGGNTGGPNMRGRKGDADYRQSRFDGGGQYGGPQGRMGPGEHGDAGKGGHGSEYGEGGSDEYEAKRPRRR